MPMSQEFEDTLSSKLQMIYDEIAGGACHVLHEKGIRDTLRSLKENARRCSIVGFKEFFAVKACPIPAVLRIVHSEGFGFDCSSESEVILARAAGAKPEDIMFTSNNTTEREWKVACADNGSILNFDDISFLDKPFFKKRGLSGTVCFRINPGELLNHESAQLQMAGNDAKYGIMPSQINEAYTRAREMGATRFGMHMMVCSNDLDYRNLVTTIRLLAELVEDLKQETGIEVSFINMGGGIGIPYEPSQRSFEIRTLFEEMWNIQNEFEERNGYSLEMYMESGRYITGPHGVLLNRAINRKKIFQEHIGVPVGMAGNPRPAVYDVYHHITVHDGKTGVRKHNRNKILKFIVNIVGPICENCDRLATLISLPRIFCDEKCGDFIVCHDTGAHSIAMAGNYNGRPRPGVWMIMMDETVQMVMYPETIEDLLARTKGL